MNWNEEKQLEPTTIDELEKLCEDAFLLKAKCDSIEESLSLEKEELNAVNKKILAVLELYGKKHWEHPLGKIEMRERTSVKTPKTEEEKKLFFEWLEQKGVYWQYVTVNSQSLNALYNAEFESNDDLGFKIPGIGEPEVFKQIILKGKK